MKISELLQENIETTELNKYIDFYTEMFEDKQTYPMIEKMIQQELNKPNKTSLYAVYSNHHDDHEPKTYRFTITTLAICNAVTNLNLVDIYRGGKQVNVDEMYISVGVWATTLLDDTPTSDVDDAIRIEYIGTSFKSEEEAQQEWKDIHDKFETGEYD